MKVKDLDPEVQELVSEAHRNGFHKGRNTILGVLRGVVEAQDQRLWTEDKILILLDFFEAEDPAEAAKIMDEFLSEERPKPPFYTIPPDRDWIGLGDKEELRTLARVAHGQDESGEPVNLGSYIWFAKVIESILRDKNACPR